MNPTLFKALVALAVLAIALCCFALLWLRHRRPGYLLLFFGSALLAVTASTHIFEALGLFPTMHFGSPHTIGHYVDLSSAVLGIVLIILGTYLTVRLRRSPLPYNQTHAAGEDQDRPKPDTRDGHLR